jgi:phage baseplate assembly protein W
MAITSISSNYVGRKKDISILQYPDASISDTQTVAPKFGKISRHCTGVQKLLQSYTVMLLTNIESQLNYPNFGTNLMAKLSAGISPVDKLAATQLFELASYETVLALKSYQHYRTDIPDDELIVSATLSDIALQGGFAAFEVSIRTEAGDAVEFVVPLPK